MSCPEEVIVPTAIQFELYKWVKRERDEVTALEIMALTEQCHVVPLDTSTALLAGDLALAHRLSFADALIYATAQQHAVVLATADDHFEALPQVEFYRCELFTQKSAPCPEQPASPSVRHWTSSWEN